MKVDGFETFEHGGWERTPRWRQLLGYPPLRRKRWQKLLGRSVWVYDGLSWIDRGRNLELTMAAAMLVGACSGFTVFYLGGW